MAKRWGCRWPSTGDVAHADRPSVTRVEGLGFNLRGELGACEALAEVSASLVRAVQDWLSLGFM